MRYKVVAIRDRAIASFGVPQFVASVNSAIRSFADLVNSKDSGNTVSVHPEDFDLFELGEYDDAEGSFHELDSPRQVAVGKDMVRS